MAQQQDLSRDDRSRKKRELVRQHSDISIFTEVLALGPTATPDSNDISAALASLAPDAVEPPPFHSPRQAGADAAVAVGDTASDGEASSSRNTGDDHAGDPFRSGVLGWALSPMWMTIDALKWAGQTVTDKAVAPVVRYASPAGWAAYIFDAVKNLTPQRACDLARIFGNATFNAVGLLHTPSGRQVTACLRAAASFTRAGRTRAAAARVVDALATTVSAPAGRQLVIDGAATFVKVAEALSTLEAKDAMQQCAVAAARFFDVLASPEAKVLLQAAADAACRAAELASSHEATVMAAEFTANVVHALEMEHREHHPVAGGGGGGGDGAEADTSRHDSAPAGGGAPPPLPTAAAAQAAAAADPALVNYEGAIVDKFNLPSTPLLSAQQQQQEGSAAKVGATAAAPAPPDAEDAAEREEATAARGGGGGASGAAGGRGAVGVEGGEQGGREGGGGKRRGAALPRYTRERFEALLTRRVEPVSARMEAATVASLEAVLSAAAAEAGALHACEAADEGAQEGGGEGAAEERSLALACAVLAAAAAWTLLGLYGLTRVMAALGDSSSDAPHDEL
ncbi:hypothetical protein JKP88DRAFT_297164 [Tribonema minus]|uniref:Uncharacterized protein n=1 Tax=Tribonema minus TaxID=303371 RepID=A0A835ZC84_9STRA|nr:hypothetical protein JKP88DRAFT_297164 [Tribonema minus]